MGLFDGSYLLPETAPLRAPWNFLLVLGKKQEIEKHWIRNEMSLPSPEEYDDITAPSPSEEAGTRFARVLFMNSLPVDLSHFLVEGG